MRRVLLIPAGLALLWGCAVPASKTPARRGPASPVSPKAPSRFPAAVPPVSPARGEPAKGQVPSAAVPAETPESPAVETSPEGLVILSSLSNLNDFTLLANGGWNANWYVGHNTCWVHRLPPAPPGDYRRAFVGAKLGAMKTEPIPGRPTWERRPVSGEVAIGLSNEPRWPQSRRYALAPTEEIPLEGDEDNALEGVGEARWFWVEVPLKSVSFDGDNYIALYSPDETLRDARRSPILAAGPSDGQVDTWLNNSVRGQPPLTPAEALKTPVVSYEPAVALKLVPAREEKPRVSWRRPPERGAEVATRLVLEAEVSGADVECAWVEVSTDARSWRRTGRRLYGAPYAFTLSREVLPRGTVQVRAAAKDVWESVGLSPVLTLKVPRK